MADEVIEQVEQGSTVDDAAAAISAILQAETDPKPNSPEPVAQAAPVEGNTATETVPEAVVVETKAPETKPASAIAPPDVEAMRTEAAKKLQEAETARTQNLQRLNFIVPQLETAVKGQFADIKTIDDLQNLYRTDPNRYADYQFAQLRLEQAQRARTDADQEQQRLNTDRYNKWRSEEDSKLPALIPDLADPVKGPTLAMKMRDYAAQAGITPQAIASAPAVQIKLLYDAMTSQDSKATLEAQLAEAKKKAASAPTVQKPGVATPGTSKDQKLHSDFARLQRSGRTEDAATVFRQLFE